MNGTIPVEEAAMVPVADATPLGTTEADVRVLVRVERDSEDEASAVEAVDEASTLEEDTATEEEDSAVVDAGTTELDDAMLLVGATVEGDAASEEET